VTAKGKEIGVSITEHGASIYIQAAGRSKLSMGRHFFGSDALLQAVDAYKSAEVKAALRSLISELA
jgi:hypothetical protein